MPRVATAFFRWSIAFIVVLCATLSILSAQEEESPFKVGGGVAGTIPVTEGNEVNPSFGLRGFLRYEVTEQVGLEFGAAYLNYVDRQKEYNQLDVEGTALPVDLRALWTLWSDNRLRTFLYAGFGITSFDADKEGTHLSSTDEHGELTGVYLHIPVGAGATYRLSYNWGIELQIGNNLGMSDGLNPNLDGTNDHLWIGTAGLLYRFGTEERTDDWLIAFEGDTTDSIAVRQPDADADADADGLSDDEETRKYLTDPAKVDTDNDGLNDSEEAKNYRTEPRRADSDGDGLKDGEEIQKHRTNPLKVDTDGDGLTDGSEVTTLRTNPLRNDTDGDGLTDGEEVKVYMSDPLKAE